MPKWFIKKRFYERRPTMRPQYQPPLLQPRQVPPDAGRRRPYLLNQLFNSDVPRTKQGPHNSVTAIIDLRRHWTDCLPDVSYLTPLAPTILINYAIRWQNLHYYDRTIPLTIITSASSVMPL